MSMETDHGPDQEPEKYCFFCVKTMGRIYLSKKSR